MGTSGSFGLYGTARFEESLVLLAPRRLQKHHASTTSWARDKHNTGYDGTDSILHTFCDTKTRKSAMPTAPKISACSHVCEKNTNLKQRRDPGLPRAAPKYLRGSSYGISARGTPVGQYIDATHTVDASRKHVKAKARAQRMTLSFVRWSPRRKSRQYRAAVTAMCTVDLASVSVHTAG